MTLPATIRVNVRVAFPTSVGGSAFITVSKANGAWTIAPDYRLLAQSPGVSATQIVALQDTATGAFSYTTALLLAAAALFAYRRITVAGAVNALSTDIVLLFQKSPSGASTLNLPSSASRGGVPITVKDLTGDANTNNITVVPSSGETIDGFSASEAAANGVALIDRDYGSKTFYPLTSGGWYLI